MPLYTPEPYYKSLRSPSLGLYALLTPITGISKFSRALRPAMKPGHDHQRGNDIHSRMDGAVRQRLKSVQAGPSHLLLIMSVSP